MSNMRVVFEHVWKKFRKGETYGLLRDSIPALMKRLLCANQDNNHLQHKEFWTLKDVSFSLRSGEALGIIGPNGAGKSTTLKLLSRILQPNRGRIHVRGRAGALIEVGAGFHPELTGRENVYLNAAIMGMTRQETDDKFQHIISFSELEDFVDTPVKRYSTGMYARLGFSVAAYLEPDILLVDEVLSVGDISFQTKCIDKIRQLQANNTTIVFVSHNMEAVLDLCQKTILLDHGEVVAEGQPRHVIKEYRERSRRRLTSSSTADTTIQHTPISISSVAFLNHEGIEDGPFRIGDNILIRIDLEAHQPIRKPVIGVAFFNDTGICIYGHNSKVDQWDPGNVCGPLRVEIKYDRVQLFPGYYFVTVGLFDTTGITPYDYRDKAYGFSIQGTDMGHLGLVHLPHVWIEPERSELTSPPFD